MTIPDTALIDKYLTSNYKIIIDVIVIHKKIISKIERYFLLTL